VSPLPLSTRFVLGSEITAEQRAFFDEHGFLVFAGVARPAEVEALTAAVDAVQARWVAEGRRAVHGIPVFIGKDPDGKPFISRFTFTSMFSDVVRSFVLDPRFEPIRRMVGADARVGHDEKDGVVVNRYLNVPGSAYPRLGWHTDGLRDLFYLRMPQPMFNVGLHFDRITAADGGLRLIPGSHRQGFWDMCFRKPYFISHGADPAEVAVETEPGDLTVHDGRLWHRVAQSPRSGWASLRRSMYVPYQTGPYEPKSDRSKTPFYHRLGALARRWRTGPVALPGDAAGPGRASASVVR
jgi:ectoine hydroxylase-related dioxygenase (phytanoyl-CoA dioxygenase family)